MKVQLVIYLVSIDYYRLLLLRILSVVLKREGTGDRRPVRPHTSGAGAVADSGDKVPGSGHLDIVSTLQTATVCPAVLFCNHDRSIDWR